ncbi:Protein of unknown function [Bacillus cytotoxicus]|uniref:Uncharacterized protein n=1 Tax=Bacillus cytotoxicus TaxID=580165 RepID=A0AAX2CFA7_9BACI|nr:Protein of unknown function [Bacillus cytotoxicus]
MIRPPNLHRFIEKKRYIDSDIVVLIDGEIASCEIK